MHVFMAEWMMPFSYLLTYSDRGDSGNIMKITRKDVSTDIEQVYIAEKRFILL